jgi:endogenous inhibitor of DNA gyrase (YacG/DUF329 family)
MAADDNDGKATLPLGTCPTCGKPAVEAHRPFCSKRCADVDLQRWFSGRYAIPIVADDGKEDPPEDDGAGQGGSGSL